MKFLVICATVILGYIAFTVPLAANGFMVPVVVGFCVLCGLISGWLAMNVYDQYFCMTTYDSVIHVGETL